MVLQGFRLDGQVAIVTGAGRGVGRGIAKVLAAAGAAVAVTARTADDLDETVALIENIGGKAIAITGDVMRRTDNEHAVSATVDRFGRVDILVNNAGGAQHSPFLQITDEFFRRHFDWNVTSAFIMSQLVAPHMIRQGAGSIVNISSGSGRFGVRGLAAYCVAKGALNQLTKAMAQELAPKIRVNALALGAYLTPALENTLETAPQAAKHMLDHIPLHRFGDPEDVGRLVVYLCAPGCYATNAIINVDGGVESTASPVKVPDL